MKKDVTFSFCRLLLTAAVAFSCYLFGSDAVMAKEQQTEPAFESEAEQLTESAVEPEAEQLTESAAEPETEQLTEPAAEPETEQLTEPAAEPETEQLTEPAAEPETEQLTESAAEPETEQLTEPVVEPEAEQLVQLAAEKETEPPVQTGLEPEDRISTGQELVQWLESHKDTGGRAKLYDHVALDDFAFYVAGADGPSLFVDTDQYTITVTGEVELWSDQRLTFSGQPDGEGIFCVAPGGMLSLAGVTVVSGRGAALWQEEGAVLVVSDGCGGSEPACFVTGDIHYADMPFVVYCGNAVCAVVEKGQTLADALPQQINCEVNHQGKLSQNQPVCVSWNLEGSEKQQEERRRFMLSGSFPGAASAQAPSCTVVYNDYPLTFTDVEATAKDSLYLFKGGFTVPEEALPLTVVPEYSFDGENWFPEAEQTADHVDAAFCMVCSCERRGGSIYIRLRWDDNGTVYFSNVLRYSTDNLAQAEDTGGSRGGGTAIVNPPEEPPQSDDPASSGKDTSDETAGGDTPSDHTVPEDVSGTGKTEGGDKKSHQTAAESVVSDAESADTGEEPRQPSEASHGSDEAKQQPAEALPVSEAKQQSTEVPPVSEAEQSTEVSSGSEEKPQSAEGLHNRKEESRPAEVAHTAEAEMRQYTDAVSAEAEPPQRTELSNTEQDLPSEAALSLSPISERSLRFDHRRRAGVILAAGAVVLSAAGGIVGCYVCSRSGTKR